MYQVIKKSFLLGFLFSSLVVDGALPKLKKTKKKVVKRIKKKKKKRDTLSAKQELKELLQPSETVAGSLNDPIGGRLFGALVVDGGSKSIQSLKPRSLLVNDYAGRAQAVDGVCPQGRRDFDIDSSDTVPTPVCAKWDDQTDSKTEPCTFLLKDAQAELSETLLLFDPKKDALLIKFEDASRLAPGACLQMKWLGNARPNSVILADELVDPYNLCSPYDLNKALMTRIPGSCTLPSPCDPCQNSSGSFEFLNDISIPIQFDANLFLHPCMTEVAEGSSQNDQLKFHLINDVEDTGNVYPAVGVTKYLYPDFTVQNNNFSPIKPIGQGEIDPLMLNISFNQGEVSCPSGWIRLGIFPHRDQDNGNRFYGWAQEGAVDQGFEGDTPPISLDRGLLCYRICSHNLSNSCGGANPSLIKVGTCSQNLLDCLCSLNLKPDILEQIIELITECPPGGGSGEDCFCPCPCDDPDVAYSRDFSTRALLTQLMSRELDNAAVRTRVIKLIDQELGE